MKSSLAVTLLGAFTVLVASDVSGVTLQLDQVKQRYPWNGLVDIDYTITYDGSETPSVDDNLEVTMIDRAVTPAVTNRALCFLQTPLPMTAGKHRITWDANADGVTNYTPKAEFHVKVVHYYESYLVIDVSEGPTAETYPVDFLNGVVSGGFNTDEYKGKKIVLKRIRPGSYMAGSPADEANRSVAVGNEDQHRVALSKPFYLGIFEITRWQWKNVMDGAAGDAFRPIAAQTYNAIRGETTNPEADTFMGKLIQKCKMKNPDTGLYDVAMSGFDLPTEFQWEYACRAGTTGAISTTNAYDNTKSEEQEAQLMNLGRFSGNAGSSGAVTNVGSYEPNAWGLYDMHGNAYEWCRDWFAVDVIRLRQYVDPNGPATGTERVRRGGGVGPVCYCRSAYRTKTGPGQNLTSLGFRLSLDMP